MFWWVLSRCLHDRPKKWCIFSVKHRFKAISLLLWATKCEQWQSNCAAVIRFHFHKTKRRWSGKSATWCYIWWVSFKCNSNHLMGNKMYLVCNLSFMISPRLMMLTTVRWKCLAFYFQVTVTLHIFIHNQIAYSWVLWWIWIHCLNLLNFFSQQSKKKKENSKNSSSFC